MPAPKGVLCPICGGKYFKHSLPIHLKSCEKKWKQTHSECKNCGQMVHNADWSDHRRYCKTKLSKQERDCVPKGPPKAQSDNRMGNLSPEEAAALIEAGSLPDLMPKADARVACKVCGRKFNPDRIHKHNRICFERSKNQRKRKTYDATKKRLEGTDFEQYAGKNRPKTPPIIAHWKEHGRRWRDETAALRQIVHADEPGYEAPCDYVPPPAPKPVKKAAVKKPFVPPPAKPEPEEVAASVEPGDQPAEEENAPQAPEPQKRKPTFSPKIIQKKPRKQTPPQPKQSPEKPPREELPAKKEVARKKARDARQEGTAGSVRGKKRAPERKRLSKPPPSRSRRSRSRPNPDLELTASKIPAGRRTSQDTKVRLRKETPKNTAPNSTKIPPRRKTSQDTRVKKRKEVPSRKSRVDSRRSKQEPAPKRKKKPAVPSFRKRGRKKSAATSAPAAPTAAEILNTDDVLEKQRKLDELLSRRQPTVKPEPPKKKKSKRRMSETGKSIINEMSNNTSNVYRPSRGRRGAEIERNPNYVPSSKKLSMEEYRRREKLRRGAAQRSRSRPLSSTDSENIAPPLCEPQAEFQASSGPRRLSRKHRWEAQPIGGKAKPQNHSEMRKRRAAYFENLLKQ